MSEPNAAGIVLFRRGADGRVELLLGHLGGPYYARKDEAAWTVPKGLLEPGEDLRAAAEREWREETGTPAPVGPYRALAPIRQSSRKLTQLYLVAGDVDAATLQSNAFELEWPPRSGRRQSVPEVDRYAWYDLETAEVKLAKNLRPLVAQVRELLVGGGLD